MGGRSGRRAGRQAGGGGADSRRDLGGPGDFLDQYIDSRQDVKPGTVDHYRRVQRDLIAYFRRSKPLRDITPGDADGFRLYLIGRGLAENTVRRICGRAKQFLHGRGAPAADPRQSVCRPEIGRPGQRQPVLLRHPGGNPEGD